MGIKMSASDKGEPWQNVFMERFFATFKEEMEYKIRNCKTITEVYEKNSKLDLLLQLRTDSHHFKTPPKAYALKLEEANLLQDTSKRFRR